jgi:branched-chain amino acid transport system substrate-binding protein
LFEVAADTLKRAKDIGEADALRDALASTSLDTVVGRIDFSKGPMKNVAKTPLAGGQWRKSTGGKGKYQLVIVDNSQAAMIPVADKLQPIA